MALTVSTKLTFLAKMIFLGMIILTGILFTSNSKLVYASGCGSGYYADYTCENGDHGWIGMDTQACPETWYLAQKALDLVYFYTNPESHMYAGSAGYGGFACVPLTSNCPSYCN